MKPPEQTFYEWAFTAFKAVCEHRASIDFKSMSGLPDQYLVYSIVYATPRGHFSDRFTRTSTRVSFAYYTRDKSMLDQKAQQILDIALSHGLLYINTSPDRFHRETNHFVRNLDFYLIEEVRPE